MSSFGLLPRISNFIILPIPKLLPLLRHNIFDPHLLRFFFHELSDISWVPKLGRDTQVFAAAHQRVGFAAFGGGWDAGGIEVLLFTSGDTDESSISRVSIL